ncbi:MAG: hypothetical protein Q4G59_12440, partial [Planctomycetia bacterium]|nr:hypothetical protein [Planctomycetia bacterium]
MVLWACLVPVGYGADPDIVINLMSPTAVPKYGTASETVFAPTRDIKIVGNLTGVDAADVQNMSFSIYKTDATGTKTGDAIRTITTDLFTSGTGEGYWSRQNDTYANLTMFDNKINFDTTAIPELVYDAGAADPTASFNDPNNKAVLYTKEDGTIVFSAVILGGITKGLDGGAGYGYAEDLTQGNYILEISAIGPDIGGQTLMTSRSEEFTFTDEGRNIVFGRYTNDAHMENMQSIARQTDTDGNKYKIMIDPFAGYYTDSVTDEFGEVQARWKPNDYMEYEQAPKVLGFIYDINASCATRHEIGSIMYQDHWNKTLDHQVYLYHYDIGDSVVQYRREDGSLATLNGTLKLFGGSVDPNSAAAATTLNNKYNQLDLTRVELYDATDTSAGTQHNIDDLTFYNKQVQRVSNYSHMVDGQSRAFVFARPDQRIGVYGVVAPIDS